MRVHDQDSYQGLCQALHADGDKGQFFLKFLESWAESAEKILTQNSDPATAIRLALEPTEAQYGEQSVALLGQMLLILVSYWERGADLAVGLTPIEMALVGECLDAKLILLEMSAHQE